MSRRILIGITFGVILVVTAGIAWRAALATKETERSIAAARRQQADLRSAAARLEERLATAQARQAELHAALERTTKGAPVVSAAKPPAKTANPAELIAHDPKLQLLYYNAEHAAMSRKYGPLFQALRLSPQDANRFADIAIRRREAQDDLMAVARDQGLTRADPEIAALSRKAEDEFKNDATALLGPDGYAQYLDYERALPVREIVERFAGSAVVNGAPLSAEQVEQFVQIMSQASPEFVAGRKANPGTIDWATVDERAAGALTPAQLALFQHIEPIGGGPSRFMFQLNQAIEAAKRADGTSPGSALDTFGKKNPKG